MNRAILAAVLFLLTTSVWAGKFLEPFDDANLKGWQELIQLDIDRGQSSWDIVNHELEGITPWGITRLLTIGNERWRNYEVEFNVKPLKKHANGNIAIAARVQGSWLVVCKIGDTVQRVLGVEPESTATCLGGDFHHIDKTIQIYASEPSPLLKLNKWSTLKLSVHEDTLIFWINGQQVLGPVVMEPRDGSPLRLTGGVGLGLAAYTARFDNIAITGRTVRSNGEFPVSPRSNMATKWGELKRF